MKDWGPRSFSQIPAFCWRLCVLSLVHLLLMLPSWLKQMALWAWVCPLLLSWGVGISLCFLLLLPKTEVLHWQGILSNGGSRLRSFRLKERMSVVGLCFCLSVQVWIWFHKRLFLLLTCVWTRRVQWRCGWEGRGVRGELSRFLQELRLLQWVFRFAFGRLWERSWLPSEKVGSLEGSESGGIER